VRAGLVFCLFLGEACCGVRDHGLVFCLFSVSLQLTLRLGSSVGGCYHDFLILNVQFSSCAVIAAAQGVVVACRTGCQIVSTGPVVQAGLGFAVQCLPLLGERDAVVNG